MLLPTLPLVVGFWGNEENTELVNAFSRWPNMTTSTSLVEAARVLTGEVEVIPQTGGSTSEAPPQQNQKLIPKAITPQLFQPTLS